MEHFPIYNVNRDVSDFKFIRGGKYMTKPFVVIHTHTSLDGKIKTVKSPRFKTTSQQYQDIALTPDAQFYDIDGYLNGRTTSEDNNEMQALDLDESVEVPEGDFVAQGNADMYYVSIDRRGVLGWTTNTIHYGNRPAHIIEVLSEKATNGYKAFLREIEISYIVAGSEELDNVLILNKLQSLFGMNRIMIGGGGVLNWSFLQAGLVDEVSIVMGPFADGDPENPSLFSASEPFSTPEAITFDLIDAKPIEDSAVWLRYRPLTN